MWNLYLTFDIFFLISFLCSLNIAIDLNNRFKSSTINVLSDKYPPSITKELEHGIKFFSDSVLQLKCNIDGNPQPSYQWYVSTSEVVDKSSNMQELQFEEVNSGNKYILEIDGKKSNKKFFKYAYYCLAQNPLGILHSNKIIVEKVSRPSDIKISHQTFQVYVGEKLVIQCHTTPDLWAGLFKFKRWEVRTKPGNILFLNKTEGRYSVITSAKTSQLHIRNITMEDFEKTKVRCIFQSTVDSGYEVNESPFNKLLLLVYEAPIYLSSTCYSEQTISVTAAVGNDIELPWCSSPKTLKIIWFKIENDGSQIPLANKLNGSKYQMISRRYGNLLIINVTKNDGGKYMALTNENIKPRQLIYIVNVYESATISLFPRIIHKELTEEAVFHCSASYTKTQFYWLHNGIKVTAGYDDGNIDIISFSNKSILQIKKTRLSVSGVYQCIAAADNELKALSEYRQQSASLLLPNVPPFLYKQSPRVEKGTVTAQIQMSSKKQQKTIECIFSANPTPNINWYLDSQKVPIESRFTIKIQEDPKSIYNFIAKLTIDLDGLIDKKYAGEYQAIATNSLGSASCKTFVLMDGLLELRLPNKQIAVGGKDYLLSCYFVAMGVPEFSWDRETKPGVWESLPSNHRTLMREKNHKLLLKNVIKAEDQGTYRCTAKFNKETRSATTNLEVANPPNLQNLPLKQDISESNYHICTVNNKADQPWYVWWTFTLYNNSETKEIMPDGNSHAIYLDFYVKYDSTSSIAYDKVVQGIPNFLYQYPNKGVNLQIKERSYDKGALGKFTCHAKNHIGSAEISIEDNFLSLEFKIVPPSTSEVVVGNSLYLNCTAKKSDLDPFTKWRISLADKYIDINNLREQYGGRIYQYSNGTLVMKDIRETDPSTMFCFIIPSKKNFEVQSKVAYIDIRIPARVLTIPNEIFQVSGTAFNLSCHVYGNTQNLFVTWFNKANDQWQELSNTCIVSRENPCVKPYQYKPGRITTIVQIHNITYHIVHLEFRDVSEIVTGEYRCMASNKFNKIHAETQTKLTIISKPSKVLEFEEKSSSSTEIDLGWTPPTNTGNRPILGYFINYLEIQPNMDKKNITQNAIKVNNTVLFLKITNLRPYQNYEISIAAENEVGLGDASLITSTTQEAIPERPVRSLKASSTQPHEILITWDDPEPKFQNGKIIQYKICYQIIPTNGDSGNTRVSQLLWPNNSEELPQNSNVKCEMTKESTLTVPYLPQFTDFGIQVKAFNSKGSSPAAFTKVRTLEDLPQASPTDLICRTQQQSIHLTWNPPGRQTINGILIGYVVHYYKPNKYGDESEMLSITVQGTTSVTLDQLDSFTDYSIQVMAANRKGLGPPSARIICKTTEAKPEPPDVVKAFQINRTCVSVSWLHTPRPHGKIIEYCVIFTGYNEKQKCQAPEFKKRYNYMISCDPNGQPDGVKVFAKNKYDSAIKEIRNIKDKNGIISIGGQINVNDKSSVILLCETSNYETQNIVWKKDNRPLSNDVNQNFLIFQNNSLEIKSIDKYSNHIFSCATEYDSIEYTLNVIDFPDGTPRAPYINDARVTENSIFISWKSRGSLDILAPITGFLLTWENQYTKESKTVSIDGNIRTFYLNNVTCASDFEIKICSSNAVGKSDYSNTKLLKTLGTIPQFPDSAILLPTKSIEYSSVNFNLKAFGPGDNCSATHFTIEVSFTSMGNTFMNSVVTKNISVYELTNKCCYMVTGLHPLTSYKYRISAFNPAGFQVIFNSFKTARIDKGIPNTKYITVLPDNQFNQTWLLMIILIIAVIFIMVFLVLGVLYIVRHRERRTRSTSETLPIRKQQDCSQPRVENTNPHEDTTSMDSNGEPSPYAVYQPDNDPKTKHIWSQQVSQTSSTPAYNYPDHLYNQIRYDKIHHFTRPEIPGDFIRRVNSAECLSSVGNASVSGIADLESPSNIDPNDRNFHGPFGRGSNNDDVFQNIQFPSCATVNRPNKRVRRESENLRYAEEERIKLVNQNPNMVVNWTNEQNLFRNHPQQPIYNQTGNTDHRVKYRQQMSVPEPNGHAFGYLSNRIRTQSGVGSSQAAIPSSSSQVNNYGNYYETHCSQSVYPIPKRDNSSIEPYSKYVPNNHLSNYAPQPRAAVHRSDFVAANGSVTRPNRNESTGDEIYTDRVVVV